MSVHTYETVIKNKNATIRRLVKERNKWKQVAQALCGALREAAETMKDALRKAGEDV